MHKTAKFLILVRQAEDQAKPQQKNLTVNGNSWVIEWSTSPAISMTVDFFNLTVGRATQQGDKKRIEEYWRVTHVPGHDRKIKYGETSGQATSTQAKPLEPGVYIVKITGITSIAEGLRVEAGVGVAVYTLSVSEDAVETPIEDDNSSAEDTNAPARIVNDTLKSLLDLTDS